MNIFMNLIKWISVCFVLFVCSVCFSDVRPPGGFAVPRPPPSPRAPAGPNTAGEDVGGARRRDVRLRPGPEAVWGRLESWAVGPDGV